MSRQWNTSEHESSYKHYILGKRMRRVIIPNIGGSETFVHRSQNSFARRKMSCNRINKGHYQNDNRIIRYGFRFLAESGAND